MAGHLRHVFVALSLLASAVGSQATITASFSIINQCLALGCFPRVKVIHTSDKIHGQVYIPDINWLLMVLSLTVTIAFHDIKKIGSATGNALSNVSRCDNILRLHSLISYINLVTYKE